MSPALGLRGRKIKRRRKRKLLSSSYKVLITWGVCLHLQTTISAKFNSLVLSFEKFGKSPREMYQNVTYTNGTRLPQRPHHPKTAQWTRSEIIDSGQKHPEVRHHFSSSLGSIFSRNTLAWKSRETEPPLSLLLGRVAKSQKISQCLKAKLFLLYMKGKQPISLLFVQLVSHYI